MRRVALLLALFVCSGAQAMPLGLRMAILGAENARKNTVEPSPPVALTYTIAFNANGGAGAMAAQTVARDANVALAANRFTRTGHVFAGWARSASGAVAFKDKAAVNNLAEAGKTATLYAQWTPTTYGKKQALSANKFKRAGYVFKGWAKSKADAKKGKVAYKNKKSVKNLTTTGKTVKLYAVWKKK